MTVPPLRMTDTVIGYNPYCPVPGVILDGVMSVWIENRPVAVMGSMSNHSPCQGITPVLTGSATVWAGGKPMAHLLSLFVLGQGVTSTTKTFISSM